MARKITIRLYRGILWRINLVGNPLGGLHFWMLGVSVGPHVVGVPAKVVYLLNQPDSSKWSGIAGLEQS